MSEENFLERWSRRKRGEANKDNKNQEQTALPPETEEAVSHAVPAAEAAPAQDRPAGEETAFDLSKLPSIESITATTDIRMFMLPGVPMALRQAALRKVWVTDPKIRDFIEMAENQWDFTADVPGFDFSAPVGDVRKMVAELLGKPEEKEAEVKAGPTAEHEDAESRKTPAPASVRRTDENQDAIPEVHAQDVAREENQEDIAPQNNDATQNEAAQGPRRRHGSAMPS